jgi:hypothetical protein
MRMFGPPRGRASGNNLLTWFLGVCFLLINSILYLTEVDQFTQTVY